MQNDDAYSDERPQQKPSIRPNPPPSVCAKKPEKLLGQKKTAQVHNPLPMA